MPRRYFPRLRKYGYTAGRVLNLLVEHPETHNWGMKEFADYLSCDERSIIRAIKFLESQGEIEVMRAHGKRNTYRVLTRKNQEGGW